MHSGNIERTLNEEKYPQFIPKLSKDFYKVLIILIYFSVKKDL